MATQKFLDQNGLQTLWGKIKQHVADSSVKYAVTATYAASAGYATTAAYAVTAGTADKVKNSLNVVVVSPAGVTSTTTFNGSGAKTATIDLSGVATDLELEAAVEALGAEIDARIASVTADETLITATTTADKKVTIGPKDRLTTAVGLAEGAVRSVTDGTTNGYIVVNTGGATAAIQVADFGSYVTTSTLNNTTNGLSASIYSNAQEISSIKTAISGGTHFIGISTTQITDGGNQKPTIGGKTASVSKGDIVIYGNKEFINTSDTTTPTWEELGDTTAESNRIKELEEWKPTITQAVSDAQLTANSAVTAAAAAQSTANSGVSAAALAQSTADSAAAAAATAAAGVTVNAGAISDVGKTASAAVSAINNLSGTVNDLSGTVNTINANYASKSVAVGSLSTSVSSPSGVTAVSATGNITKWTITPKSVAGATLTVATIEIESIPDSWITNLS